jgi:hypothetical protein
MCTSLAPGWQLQASWRFWQLVGQRVVAGIGAGHCCRRHVRPHAPRYGMATTAASALPVAAASLALPWRSWKALLDVTIAWSLEGSCWIVEIKACCRSSTLSGTTYALFLHLLDSLMSTLVFVTLEHLCTRRAGLHGRLQHLPSNGRLYVRCSLLGISAA